MSEDFAVIPLFSTPVYKKNLGNILRDNKKTIEHIKDICKEKENEGNITWQTSSSGSSNVLKDSKLRSLNKKIKENVEAYIYDILEWGAEVKIQITSSWCNEINKKEQFHHPHGHPNSIISGVFYFETLEEDKINFFNNNLERNSYYDIPIKNYNIFNSPTWWIPIEKNDLVLFPSDFRHAVPNNMDNDFNKNIRFSLSFNTFFKCEFSHNPTTYAKF